jgi:hypothetical protein
MLKFVLLIALIITCSSIGQVIIKNATTKNAKFSQAIQPVAGPPFTLINHGSTKGTSGDTTVTLDSTGCNFAIVIATGGSLSKPTIVDGKSNTGWNADVDWTSSHVSIFSCNLTSVGTGHTFTIQSAGGLTAIVLLFNKTGGAAVFDAGNVGSVSGNWDGTTVTAGSVTPTTGNNLFVSGIWYDVGNGVGDTCIGTASFSIIENVIANPGGQGAIYIANGDSNAQNAGWKRGTSNNSDAAAGAATYH